MEVQSVNMVQDLPLVAARLDDVQAHTAKDDTLQVLTRVILEGWPEDKTAIPAAAMPYLSVMDELSVQNGIILRGERALIPKSLRHDMLRRIHMSHMDMEGCLRRARECVYWPAMSIEVKDFILKCDICRSVDNKQQKETLISHDVPNRPWAKVGVDLFTFNQTNHLIIVDYFSGFWEIYPVENTTASQIIRKMKMQFARHGIPDVCVSDNGPQFTAHEYKNFSKQWKFEVVTTSPRYPKSNGKVENAVGAAKRLMKKAKKNSSDAYLALLDNCNTPTQGLDTNPAQRLMSRRTKTLLPTAKNLLVPEVTMGQHQKILANKQRQAKYYNKAAHDLPALISGDVVRVNLSPDSLKQEDLQKAQVKAKVGVRSFEVETEDGKRFRRNRIHLRKSNETFSTRQPAGESPFGYAPAASTANPLGSVTPPFDLVADQSPVGPAPIHTTDPLGNSSEVVTTLPNDSPYRIRHGCEIKRPKHLRDYV